MSAREDDKKSFSQLRSKIPLLQFFHDHSSDVKRLFSTILLSATFLTMLPDQSDAVPSGSRSGGSSFRSAPSYRSSSRLGSERGGGSYSLRSPSYRSPSSTTIIPVLPSAPLFSPFSFGFGYPSFGFGWGLSPFSLFNPNLLLFGGIAYATYLLLAKNRIGGSDFSQEEDGMRGGSLGSGCSVIRLQLAIEDDWSDERGGGSIMRSLSSLSSSPTTRSDLSLLLGEVSLALLRRKDRWTPASLSGERFKRQGGERGGGAEPFYQQLVIQERSKFEKEINPASPSISGDLEGRGRRRPQPTKAVVSVVAAIRGQSRALDFQSIRSEREVVAALQALASEAQTDGGENVMAVEVLWTPSQEGEVLTEKDLIVDYPELKSL